MRRLQLRTHAPAGPARLTRTHPVERLVLALSLVLFVAVVPPRPWAIVVLAASAAVVVGARRADETRWGAASRWIAWLAGPSAFAAVASAVVMWRTPWLGLDLLLRSVASVGCLGMLAQATPVFQVVGVLQRSGLAPAFVELLLLMHNTARTVSAQLRSSQQALSWRVPNAGWLRSLDAVALVFQSVWRRAERDLARRDRALAWRCFGERPQVLAPAVAARWSRVAGIVAAVSLAAAAIWLSESRAG